MTTLSTDIPTLPGLPVLGHALRLLRDPLRFICSLRAHGEVVAIRVGPATVYVITDPGLVRQVLVDQSRLFDKGRQFEKLRLWLGEGLSTSEGDFHLRQRRLAQPAFHRRRVAGYVADMQDAAHRRVAAWPPGRPIELDRELCALLVTMVARTLFSASVDEQAIGRLQAALPVILAGVGWRVLDTTELLEKLPLPANRRFNDALATVHAIADGVIDSHDNTADDLLTALQQARDADTGQQMSAQQVYDEVITLMMVGSETTSTNLGWACHLLSRHPQVQHGVQAEVDEVLGGRAPQAEDLARLTFTRRVFTEALRLYPSAWLLTRRASTEVDLGGYRIPAGAQVCYSPYALHRDPAVHPDPDRFDPDRWLPERAQGTPRNAYIPFGAGNRGCIGEPIAWAQATVTLAAIAQRWTLHPVPGAEVKPVARMLLMPNHLRMIPVPRHAA
jgi:pentalenene oxygenase